MLRFFTGLKSFGFSPVVKDVDDTERSDSENFDRIGDSNRFQNRFRVESLRSFPVVEGPSSSLVFDGGHFLRELSID